MLACWCGRRQGSALPDGKVLIGQGVNRSPGSNVYGRPCTFEEREGHHFQMFDPETGSVTKLAKTTVSRGLHGTATLLPDASVFFAGENREALVQPDDASFPLMSSYAGLLPRGDPDQGFPSGKYSTRLACSSMTVAEQRVRLSLRRPRRSRTAGAATAGSRATRARLPRSCCFAAITTPTA